MTDEQLRRRLEPILQDIERLHHEIQADAQVEGQAPDPEDIGEDAFGCADAILNIQASVACLFDDIPLRSLPIRGALRHRRTARVRRTE